MNDRSSTIRGDMRRHVFAALALLTTTALPATAHVTAIRAGRLLEPEAGRVLVNQVTLVETGRFTAVGADVRIPPVAQVINLSQLTVMPGLVYTHNHLALTYK